jgi:hypothetical protein
MRQDQSNKSALKAPKTKTIFEIGAMIENLDSSTKASIGFDVSCPIDSSSYSLQPYATKCKNPMKISDPTTYHMNFSPDK